MKNKWQDAFIRNSEDGFCIFQLKRIDETAELLFMNSSYLKEHDLDISYENYEAVYCGHIIGSKGVTETLDDIYMEFNRLLPEDFKGSSVSVSDVIALKRRGKYSYHYVDSIGFALVFDFIPARYFSENFTNIPLYLHDGGYAREHDELPQYRESYKANVACKEALESAINSNYHDNCLNTVGVMENIAYNFSRERIAYVLANTIQYKDWDGRICRANKEWAKTVTVVPNPDGWGGDRNCYFVVDQAHTGLVDLFASHFRNVLSSCK